MPSPSHERLRREKERGRSGVYFSGRFVHPRPEFYKYYFYLFTRNSPQEGQAFFNKDNRLCIADYRKRCEEIEEADDLAYAYNERHPRRGDATPFDESHPRWDGIEWAPPLHKDPDPAVDGGHR